MPVQNATASFIIGAEAPSALTSLEEKRKRPSSGQWQIRHFRESGRQITICRGLELNPSNPVIPNRTAAMSACISR